MHNDIHLTMATWDYDHVRDLATGMVKPKGIELTHLQMGGRGDILSLRQVV